MTGARARVPRNLVGSTLTGALIIASLIACASRSRKINSSHVGDHSPSILAPQVRSCPRPQKASGYGFLSRQDTVLLEFVVDTAGNPELNTIKVDRTTNPNLNQGAVDFVTGCSFRPGTVDGHRARMMLNMPLTWSS